MQSYSNALIKFVLTHYLDIVWGKITPDEMNDFTQSAGRKNPLETALIWKSDIDQALISLTKKTGWKDALAEGMSDSMILHLSRSNELSNMQRTIVGDCILRDCCTECKKTGHKKPLICWNEGIITRMRKYLNGDFVPNKYRVEVTQ